MHRLLRFVSCGLLASLPLVAAPATTFNYGGSLNFNGAPVSGPAEFQFRLFTAPTGGNLVNPNPPTVSTMVNNGTFNAAIDLNTLGGQASIQDNSHSIQDNWFEVSVRRPGEADFTPLLPRQQFSPLPAALVAEEATHALTASAVLPRTINLANLAAENPQPGTVLGVGPDGFNLSWLPLPKVTLGSWLLNGNSGTTDGEFLGTTDSRPLVLAVSGNQAVRFEGGAAANSGFPPNIIGGGAGNTIPPEAYGSFIGNGSYLHINSFLSFVGGGSSVTLGTNSPYGFIGGGFDNQIGDNSGGSVLTGGENNRLLGSQWAVVAGGVQNVMTNADGSVIGGGSDNSIRPSDAGTGSQDSVIAGGDHNQVFGSSHVIIGGGSNNAITNTGAGATIAGGQNNLIGTSASAAIGGGYGNRILLGGDGAVIGGGTMNTVGLGDGANNAGYATIPGGYGNLASGEFSFAAGLYALATNLGAFVWSDGHAGQFTQFGSVVENEFAVRARGGIRFVTEGAGLTVDGVTFNPAGAGFALANGAITSVKLSAPNPAPGKILTLGPDGTSLVWGDAPAGGGGGAAWLLGGNAGTVDGQFIGTTDNRPLEFRVNNQPALRISLDVNPSGQHGQNVVGGIPANSVAPGIIGATIGGGGLVDTDSSLHPNHIIGDYGVIAGGFDNFVGSEGGSIGGGSRNQTTDNNATVAGGLQNFAQGNSATVGGGFSNVAGSANGLFATVSGGTFNNALGEFATIPGGDRNAAAGESSFAAGHQARADHKGSFVWADSTAENFASAAADEFAVRAHGGARFDTAGQGLNLDGTEVHTRAGGLWVTNSGAFDPALFGENDVSNGMGVQGISNAGFGVQGLTDTGYGLFGRSIHNQPSGAVSAGVVGTSTDGLGVLAQSADGVALQAGTHTGTGLSVKSDSGNIIAAYRGVGPNNQDDLVMLLKNDGTLQTKSVDTQTLNQTSDRNAKEGFTAVNAREVLAKVAALPITRWQFKGDAAQSQHVGPMAQDFREAFGLGKDERHIATVDEEGVALAAIQGLNSKLEAELNAKDAQIQRLTQTVGELKSMVEALARQSGKEIAR